MKVQVWLKSGQDPSQVARDDRSQGIGTQRQVLRVPVVSGMQMVPGGQPPSQAGKSDCSQEVSGGSQRQLSRSGSKKQSWPGSGQSPSQVATGESSQDGGRQSHLAVPEGSSRQNRPAGHSPSQVGKGAWLQGTGVHSQAPEERFARQMVP
jgi:hypothetical protein